MLQPIVSEGLDHPRLTSFVELKVKGEVEKSQCLAINNILWTRTAVTVVVAPQPGSSRQVVDMIRNSLKDLIENKLSGKLLGYNLSDLEDYSEIDQSRYAIVETWGGVAVIAFDVEIEVHRIHSILESKKIEETVTAELHMKPILEDYISRLVTKQQGLAVTESTRRD